MTSFESKTLERALKLYQLNAASRQLDTLAGKLLLQEQGRLYKTITRLQYIQVGRNVWRNRLAFHWSLFIGSAGL